MHDCALSACGCGSRRGFLKSVAAAGAAAALPGSAARAQEPAAKKPHRIDVHHHFFPQDFLAEFERTGERVAGVAKSWSIARTLEQMDRGGVASAMLSIPFRQPKGLAPDRLRPVTRAVNDYGVQAIKEHPRRFGLFAYLPLPDVEGTLKEIQYAFDVIKADGVGLFTSYDDKWLGDPAFRPVLEELNRRKAIAYVHPLSPQCCGSLMEIVPPSLAEYPQDTNRTILSLLLSGSLTQLPDIRWIFSHGGGAMPLLAGRVASLLKSLYKDVNSRFPNGIDAEFQRLYYETANAGYASNMAALLKFVPLTQVLFGTDYPYISVTENVGDITKAGLAEAELRAIETDNALRLVPRLRA
jgi:predicted TIM-barrel fold metal-dependent hydrolase